MIDEQPTDSEIAFVDRQLKEFNREAVGDDFVSLNLVVRREDDSISAGLNAVTGWQWMYVQVLWVHPSVRCEGMGTQLLNRAEEIALARGCLGSCLSSYSFQAPDFYLKRGYTKFGTIDDYPTGHAMHFFSKRLR